MADAHDYVYIVEWDDTVHRPPFTVTHNIKLKPGVSREAFEKFMTDKGFAQAAAVKTRMGEVAAQYLLTESSGPPARPEDLDLDVSSFASRTDFTKFKCVSSWRRMSGLRPG